MKYLLLASVLFAAVQSQIFILPNTLACQNMGKERKWTWEEARNYCREFCMDSISISSRREKDWVASVIRNNDISYIWTGGRKCNFAGCDRADLQPSIENGWYWAPTGVRIAPPGQCRLCEWSRTGGLGEGQPDNREQRQGGLDEACIAILNNFYNDGVAWHDVECQHRKPVICQESQGKAHFASSNNHKAAEAYSCDRF